MNLVAMEILDSDFDDDDDDTHSIEEERAKGGVFVCNKTTTLKKCCG